MRRITSIVALLLSLILALSGCGGQEIQQQENPLVSQTEQVEYEAPVVSQEQTETVEQPNESTAFDLSSIPRYNDSPYVAVNDNNPYFTESDYTTESFEKYDPLDALGRCGVAYANISIGTMPTEPRGNIGNVKPSGWHSIRYENVEGLYLYNRCHLIGYQLSAENANTSNLITGTRYLNIHGMLPFESMVADYVKETKNHVLYRVTPIFEGNNLLASGVLMEGYSVEDDGEGICYNVYCYNVQPGIKINYATGDSKAEDGSAPYGSSATVTKPAEQNNNSANTTFIANKNTKKFHYPYCSSVKQMKDKNKKELNCSREEAIQQGYSPCGNCMTN